MNIKHFFLKKNIVKKLAIKQAAFEQKKIDSIGIIMDSSKSDATEFLLQELYKQGITKEQITILNYKEKVTSKEVVSEPYFTLKDLSFSGEIQKQEVVGFLKSPFDMLINYYDGNKYELIGVTLQSKANFKVGFESVDYRVNNLIIKGVTSNPKEFVLELFKYLKILKAI